MSEVQRTLESTIQAFVDEITHILVHDAITRGVPGRVPEISTTFIAKAVLELGLSSMSGMSAIFASFHGVETLSGIPTPDGSESRVVILKRLAVLAEKYRKMKRVSDAARCFELPHRDVSADLFSLSILCTGDVESVTESASMKIIREHSENALREAWRHRHHHNPRVRFLALRLIRTTIHSIRATRTVTL